MVAFLHILLLGVGAALSLDSSSTTNTTNSQSVGNYGGSESLLRFLYLPNTPTLSFADRTYQNITTAARDLAQSHPSIVQIHSARQRYPDIGFDEVDWFTCDDEGTDKY